MTMQPDDQNQVDDSAKHPIRLSDLPGEIRTIANLIGLNQVLKLANEYGGTSIYVPKFDAITRAVRDRVIKAEFTGNNHKGLAKKYKLTQRHVRKIIEKES
jgi:Mor family transcriptional regulator